jgi:protein phosphatase
MPWSAKAETLLRTQYAAVGAAAEISLRASAEPLGVQSKPEFQQLSRDWQDRLDCVAKYRAAYRRYCWPVHSFRDLKIAPFFLLASEGRTYFDQAHSWHLEQFDRMAAADPHNILSSTSSLLVNVRDEASQESGIQWWLNLTGSGSEGMVIKPLDPIGQQGRSLVQPGIKCRGREYLRIIYGPEYTRENNLNRLRERGLGRKRALALREFALGIEALERFVNREPLRRIHECVLGVLALESEPVDPRL